MAQKPGQKPEPEPDLEITKSVGRIHYAYDVERSPHRDRARRGSQGSMSIRSVSRQRTADPSVVLPVQFRTL